MAIPPGVIDPTLTPGTGRSYSPANMVPLEGRGVITYPLYRVSLESAIDAVNSAVNAAVDAYNAQWARIAGLYSLLDGLDANIDITAILEWFRLGLVSLNDSLPYMDEDALVYWTQQVIELYNASQSDEEATTYRDYLIGYCNSRNSGRALAMAYIDSAQNCFDKVVVPE